METRTIDDLLSYLESRINVANPEKFRGDVMDFVRHVFTQEIGLELIGFPFEETVDVVNHILKAPSHLLKLEDLSFDGYTWSGFQVGRDMQPLGSLAFEKSPYGYRLPNLSRGKVFARGIGLPKDENGDAVIPADMYLLLARYCLGRALEDYPQHPLYQARYAIQQEADLLIAKARATLNQGSVASNRTERHATGHIRIANNSNLFWNNHG